MKNLLIPTLTIFLYSCTAKHWNKEAAKKWYMQDNKIYVDDGTVTVEKAAKICDCVAKKCSQSTNQKQN